MNVVPAIYSCYVHRVTLISSISWDICLINSTNGAATSKPLQDHVSLHFFFFCWKSDKLLYDKRSVVVGGTRQRDSVALAVVSPCNDFSINHLGDHHEINMHVFWWLINHWAIFQTKKKITGSSFTNANICSSFCCLMSIVGFWNDGQTKSFEDCDAHLLEFLSDWTIIVFINDTMCYWFNVIELEILSVHSHFHLSALISHLLSPKLNAPHMWFHTNKTRITTVSNQD